MLAADRRPRPYAYPVVESLWAKAAPHPVQIASGTTVPRGDAGGLRFPRHANRPTVIANFVSTMDGVVSFADADAAAGGEISGFSSADRMVMGLLRAHADAVLVGAGTVRAAPHDSWTPEAVFPPAASSYQSIRRQLGLPPQPLTVVVSASGGLDLQHPGLSAATPVLIVTTAQGATRLALPPENVELATLDGPRIAATDLLDVLARRGTRLVLCEGGPHLLASLLSADLIDELFLTVAPQIAGRSSAVPRPALVEGVTFSATEAPWWELRSVDRAGSHLFLRYRRDRHRAMEARV